MFISKILLGLSVLVWWAGIANAGIIANSISEFSSIQGANNWSYGFFDNSGLVGYQAGGFTQFDTFVSNSWKASNTLVPSSGPGIENNFFLNINANGGHPTGTGIAGQDRLLWAIRRYTSEVAGLIQIDYDLRKVNFTNPNGGGITGRIFVDGQSILDLFIKNSDNIGVQSSLFANVNVGSVIDFAIDSLGVATTLDSDPRSPRADGSHFSAVISSATTVPEPSAAIVMFGISALFFITQRRGCNTFVNCQPEQMEQFGLRAMDRRLNCIFLKSMVRSVLSRGCPKPAITLIASMAAMHPTVPDTAPKTGNSLRQFSGGAGERHARQAD